MITMTLRENKSSLQPTAEDGFLTNKALCQVLRLLLGLLPGSEQVSYCFDHPHPVSSLGANPGGCKKLCQKSSLQKRVVGRGKTS